MKKKNIIIAGAIALAIGLACLACSPKTDGDSGKEPSGQTGPEIVAKAGSVMAYHTTLGLDMSAITEVSIDACSACHSWDKVVASTVDMWEGLGQITDANPHDSHATNAFACGDCHKLYEPQVNVCDQCHIFPSPEGWVEKDKTSTNYGITEDEPLY